MGLRERLEGEVRRCGLCDYVDKPFLEHGVYSWLPERTKILAIGESPPPGKKVGSLYNTGAFDRLRLSLAFILGVPQEKVLERLRGRGIFFTASVKCRPPDRKSIEEMRRRCVPLLRGEIRALQPRRVLAMGRFAASSVCEIFGLEPPPCLKEIRRVKRGSAEIFFAPHPNYIFRFGRGLAPELASLLG